MTAHRGRLIVLEGAEAVGKSTQFRRLSECLAARGIRHEALREPGGTALGDEIRRLLLDPASRIGDSSEALLFMASRAQLVSEVLVPALGEGALVLLDRFFLSTYAYQIAGRGLGEREVREANALAIGGLRPDLTLVLSVPAAERARRRERRGGSDRMERTGEQFHERVQRAFERALAPEWQAAHPECGPIAGIDGTGAEEDVFARVMEALASRWPETFSALLQSQ